MSTKGVTIEAGLIASITVGIASPYVVVSISCGPAFASALFEREEIDVLIRALAAARVELTTQSPP